MTPQDATWALGLRQRGLTTAEIARLLVVSSRVVPRIAPGVTSPRHGSTFVNGRGWV